MSSADLRLLEPFWREPVFRTTLPNGVVAIIKRDRSAALASVQVWVRTGSIHEGALLGSGMSHYLEHMVFKGTARRAAREISATAQAHGGYINAYTTYDRTVYHIDLPSEHFGVAVDLLADLVLHPSLPPAEAIKEREVILREIAMTRDDPENRLWEGLFASVFREHPYRHPVIGHRDLFAALAPERLVEYHKSRYAPENLVVVIVGDVDPAAAHAEIERTFGAAPRRGLAPVYVPSEPPQLAPRELHREEDVEVSRGALAWPIPGLTHSDAPALDLLALVLGHGDSSVLWQEVREKQGLVHAIDAVSWNPGTTGLFCVSFTCEPAKRADAVAAIERVIERAGARPWAAGSLRKALRQMAVGEINTRKTMGGQAARLGAAEVVVGDLDYSRAYFRRLAEVTSGDLRRVLHTYLAPARRTSVSINPTSAGGRAARGRERERVERSRIPTRATDSDEAAGIPDFSEIRLPNGARLLLQRERRLPNLHLRLVIQGGPLAEQPGKRGATALLATLLAKDAGRRSAAQVAKFIEEVGGSFQPFSGNNSLGLAAEVLPIYAGRAISLIAEGLFHPAFKSATFAIEREAQLASLRLDEDDVVTFARKLLRRKFFGAYPLALDTHGDRAGVEALTPGDLSALHRRLCVGSNVALAVAGDFEPRKIVPGLKAFLSRLPAGKVDDPAPPLPTVAGDFEEKRPCEQAVVLQAFPAPVLHGPDFFAGEVADELFSGMASRLFERVREEKGLAYFVRSSRVTGLAAGMFFFFAGTQPGREGEVLAEIDAEIARVRSGAVEEAELSRCRARLKTARRESLQTNGARAAQAGLDALHGMPLNDWRQYDARIDSVGREDLAQFARNYFVRERRVQLIVRP